MRANTSAGSKNRIVALFPALFGVGGIQEAGRLTSAALAQIGSDYGWPVECLSLNDPPHENAFSLSGTAVPFAGFGRAKVRFVLSAMARARRTRIVIAAHPDLALPAAQMRFAQSKLKIAVIAHGVEAWQRLPALRRRAFLGADVFLAPSRYTAEQIIRTQGAPREKTSILHWQLSPEFVDLSSRAEALPLPADFPPGPVLLTTARLSREERYKGVDQLIRALAQLAATIPSVHLAVVGSGDDLARHEQLARELGVSNRVRFFTGLSRAQIAACYSRCVVFALPSTGEGFGFVFLEAMAFGKPVIGAAAGGVPDIVEHQKNGLLVPPNDLAALAAALERLLLSQPLRSALGSAALETVHRKFLFERFRSQLQEVLRACGLARLA